MRRRSTPGTERLRGHRLLAITLLLALAATTAMAAGQVAAPSESRRQAPPQLDLLSAPGVRPSVKGIVYRSASERAQPAVLVLYGEKDRYAGPDFVAKVAGGLRTAGRIVEVQVYDGLGHGFNFLGGDDERARRATRDAEARVQAFLARYLK